MVLKMNLVGVLVAGFLTLASGQNNAAILGADIRLEKFVQLLDRAGISPSSGNTIFAPTTEAFQTFEGQDAGLWKKYTEHPEFFLHLRDILLWHLVTQGEFMVDDIFDGDRWFLENSRGNITVDQKFKKLDNLPKSAIIDQNITTSDGIIHVVDQVMVPPYLGMNLIEQMLDDQSAKFAFTTMANLALHVGLDEKINAMYENGITMLVPPNRRFNRAEIDVTSLLTPEMFNYTRDFVLCHMIMNNYYESGVFAYNKENRQEQFLVKSELGTNLWITTTDDRLRFQSTDTLLTDQAARNGIFHVLNLPLFPPYISDFTFFTHKSTNATWDTSDCFRFFRQSLLSSEEISSMFNTTLTFFCPTREAFESFNNEDFARLLEPIWVRHATEFLFNHISGPARTRKELVEAAPSTITMLNGATYDLKKSGPKPRIKNGNEQARSAFGDLIALDGYVHMTDSAITPTAVSRSIYDQSNLNPDFSLLVENIDYVDLTDIIDRDLPLTLLAPDNTAWRRIIFGTTEGGDIIKRHLFRGLFFWDVLANMTQISSVNRMVHGVELRGEFNEFLYVGGAYVYKSDILARNGVLHHIDRVIGVDYPTVPPTTSPAPTITAQPTAYVPPTAAPIMKPTGIAPVYIRPGRIPTINDLIHNDADKDGQEASSASRTPLSIFGLILTALAFW